MKLRRITLLFAAVAALALAGCSGDMAKQIATNEQFRTQVFTTLTSNPALASQTLDKLMANDSLRAGLVDHLLGDDNVAMQVIVRIGTNPQALDQVIGVAAKDSTMRSHLITLVHGMEMATGK